MNSDEKLRILQKRIEPDTASDDLLSELLEQAGAIVLNRRFPFGYPGGTEVPVQYARIQIAIAMELYAKRGAEAQTAHSENGISRTYEAGDISPSLMKQIVPLVGSVMTNAIS